MDDVFNIQDLLKCFQFCLVSDSEPWGDNVLMEELKIFWQVSTQKYFKAFISAEISVLFIPTHVSELVIFGQKMFDKSFLLWLIALLWCKFWHYIFNKYPLRRFVNESTNDFLWGCHDYVQPHRLIVYYKII